MSPTSSRENMKEQRFEIGMTVSFTLPNGETVEGTVINGGYANWGPFVTVLDQNGFETSVPTHKVTIVETTV